jgi:hypothetical protein
MWEHGIYCLSKRDTVIYFVLSFLAPVAVIIVLVLTSGTVEKTY